MITDSNSGITQEEAKKTGDYSAADAVFINDELYYEDITLSQEEFYRFLAQNADVKTSQPTPEAVLNYGTRPWKRMTSWFTSPCPVV